jgi:hypothetical protein
MHHRLDKQLILFFDPFVCAQMTLNLVADRDGTDTLSET